MTFKSKCSFCGSTSYGWGDRCMCGFPIEGVHIVDRHVPITSLRAAKKRRWNEDVTKVVKKFAEAQGLTKGELSYEDRDYDSSVKDANEPDHDLEYHDKKLEGRR